MRKIYLKRSNGKRKNTLITIFTVIAISSLFFLFSDKIINKSLKISMPVQAALWNKSEPVFDWIFSIARRGDLIREVERLANENERLTSKIVDLQQIEKDNEILRTAMNLGIDKDFSISVASVMGTNISKDAIVINKGDVDGIKEGMVILTEKKVIVGVVSKTFDEFSKVNLITHEEFAFEAEIQGKGAIALVKGTGKELKMTLVPKDVEVNRGDSIITVPLSGIFPPNLFIGLVAEVEGKDSDLFQEINIKPYFNIKRLDKVFIITDEDIDL